ncbi:ATP-binding protein [Pendulispora brunnea]|uniref:histidine kinase n=1 Tax=Pendulispora brunnea TaxID=2905690 RepID=A0ABZ2KFA8_9BACT
MKRLFLRTFLGLCVIYLLALTVGARLLYHQPVTSHADLFRPAYGPSVSLARERLAAVPPEQRRAELERVRAHFKYPLDIFSWDSDGIDSSAREELAGGASLTSWFGYEPGKGGSFLASAIEPHGDILRFGPLPGSSMPTYPRWASVVGGVGITLALGTWLLLWPIAKQFRALEEAARRLQSGDLRARANEAAASTRPIAQAFNAMAEDLHRHIDAQRDLLRTVSHELRTPLARIRFAIDRLATTESAEARAAQLDEIDGDLSELDDLVDELLTWSRLETAAPPHEALAVESLLLDLEGAFPDIELVDVADGLQVRGDRRLLTRALGNLAANALRYARSRVVVRALRAGDTARIVIEDDGPGIPEPERERVFEPFVRLHSEGRGVGLGLAIVRRIADQHGGSVRIESADPVGCRAILELPLAR